MVSRLISIPFMLLILVFLTPGHAAWARAAENADTAFTTVTTHIEGDSWHFLRVHRSVQFDPPAPLPPLPPVAPVVATPGDDKASSVDINLAGLFIYKQFVDPQHRVRARHEGLLQLPFIFGDYLFALYDGTDHYGYDKKNAWGGNVTHSRLVLVDTLIVFTGFESRFDAPDSYYWEALNVPLITTLSHRIDGNKTNWTVLDVPLACGFSYHSDGNSANATLLDLPLANLYSGSSHRVGAGKFDSHWAFFDVPFFTLMESDHHGADSSFTLADGPLFYLWRQHEGRDSASVQLLRLPLIGPLFSWKTGKDGSKVGVLPDIF